MHAGSHHCVGTSCARPSCGEQVLDDDGRLGRENKDERYSGKAHFTRCGFDVGRQLVRERTRKDIVQIVALYECDPVTFNLNYAQIPPSGVER